MSGSTVTLRKELLVLEDILTGVGTVVQVRGVGTLINASNLSFNGTISIAAAIALKADASYVDSQVLTRALLAGSTLQTFDVATATLGSHATTLLQMNTALALKSDITSMNLKADKANVLELNNSTAFTPTSPYQPATKKYVDDMVVSTGAADMRKAIYDIDASGIVDTTEGVGVPATFMGISPSTQVMRMGQTAITDCNTIVDMGVYHGTLVANAPASGAIVLSQQVSGTSKYQECFATATGHQYTRSFDGITWGIWYKDITDADIVNNLAGNTSVYSVLSADQGKALDLAKSPIGHTHTGVYEPADATILKSANIGITVQGYDANTVKAPAGVLPVLSGANLTNLPGDATKLPLAGGTMTGAITALRETKVAMGANDIDLAAGNLFTKTIAGITTLTVSNWLASGNANSFILELINGGAFAVTWFAGVKWASGVAPTLTAAGVDILGFYSHDGGTTVRGILLAKDSK